MMQINKAVPRICVGNISVDITNFKGPGEKAKNKMNNIMLASIIHPAIFIRKQKAINANANAADALIAIKKNRLI